MTLTPARCGCSEGIASSQLISTQPCSALVTMATPPRVFAASSVAATNRARASSRASCAGVTAACSPRRPCSLSHVVGNRVSSQSKMVTVFCRGLAPAPSGSDSGSRGLSWGLSGSGSCEPLHLPASVLSAHLPPAPMSFSNTMSALALPQGVSFSTAAASTASAAAALRAAAGISREDQPEAPRLERPRPARSRRPRAETA
mmetsp:Transcript_1729/g.4409  ORF Transcript_1729/g.4409 Transcript_1729/m.4409 type:complete len:202 (+) Transcript_1729:320-925(+)